MTQEKYISRRDEMLKQIGKQREEIVTRIGNNQNSIIDAKRRAAEYGEWQRISESQQEMARAGQLQREVQADQHKLIDLDRQREDVVRGSHPELAALATTSHSASCEKNQKELSDAWSAFREVLSPDVKAAAKRLVEASLNANPFAPVPTLADAISEGA